MTREHLRGEVGWTAPGFALPDAQGTVHDRDDLMGPAGLVVAFICNHCPYVKAVGHRMAKDARALAEIGVGFVAVNSNDFERYTEDAPDRMPEFARSYGFDFPYVVDADQSLARRFDAACTPEFFGLDRSGKLHYRGRLDSAAMGSDPADRTAELLDAMRLVAETGRGPDRQISAIGCSIKWR